ncbi:MAG: ArnT family glycosyltransferase [Betaproteobacteria bacterium]
MKKSFLLLLLISTVVKLWFAAFFPFTGDEAYFYQWGAHPDWGGFYDHPPMVGWWLWALQQISSHTLVLRLPAVLLWIAVVFGMMNLYVHLFPHHAERRWLLGSLFLALPFTWAFNLITTDTPLVLFLFFSGYAFVRAELENRWHWYAASGTLLGLALLSKYFAGLLAITYAIYLLPRRGGIARLFLVAVCALPFMLLNMMWNATHCWNNILFNLINRNQGAHFSVAQVLLYVVMLLYLMTPWVFVALWRRFKQGGKSSHDDIVATPIEKQNRSDAESFHVAVKTNVSSQSSVGAQGSDIVIAVLFIVPFGLFLLLSFYKQIGLHWLLAFIPFVFLFAAAQLPNSVLYQLRRWNLWFGLPHLLLLLALMYLPIEVFKPYRIQPDIVLHRDGGDVVYALKQDMADDAVLMTRSYSQSSLLAYHAQAYIPVFGFGSFHARFDDAITDFRQLDGKNIRIASTSEIEVDSLRAYFSHVSVQDRMINGARFWIADGEGFRFEPYRAQVLSAVAERYYKAPSWLPVYGCRFLETYGFI